MKKPGFIRGVAVVVVSAFLLVGLMGCTKYASEEDIQRLETQQQAALSAEKKLEELKSRKDELRVQVAKENEKLQKALAEKKEVEDRLEKMKKTEPEEGG